MKQRPRIYYTETQKALMWERCFTIHFHGLRHPAEMGATEVQTFLSYLFNKHKMSAATHKQALCALPFLCKQVLQMELPWMGQLHQRQMPLLLRQKLAYVARLAAARVFYFIAAQCPCCFP